METAGSTAVQSRPFGAGFYLYEHSRADTGAVFYVGKGCGDRAKSKQGRNAFWRNVVARAGGYRIVVVVDGMDEELAYLAEAERIDQLRRIGIRLCNMTDGGEGMTGHRHGPEARLKISLAHLGQSRPAISEALKGVPKSESHRKALSLAKTGKSMSAESRARMSITRKGKPSSMLGKRHSLETKARISLAVAGALNPFYGRVHSEESRNKMSAAHFGVKLGAETRSKMSASRRGELNPRFGVKISEEQKQRQIASLKARPQVQCPHCLKSMDEGNAKRWHFDNCNRK